MRAQVLFYYWMTIFSLSVLPSQGALSSGCGKPLPGDFADGETKKMEIPAEKGQPTRHYSVHLPANYKNNRGHAIVFSFHGHRGNMIRQEDLSQLSSKGLLINGAGIIAVYPRGKKGTKGGGAWQSSPYVARGVDDIAFVEKMISKLQQTLCVETTRIYAMGKSNGGGFVNLLACTPSTASKIAAFATVSAALYPDILNGNCPTQRSIPILDFHGTDDETASYYGGRSYDVTQMSVDNFRRGWVTRNGCQSTPIISYLPQATDPQRLIEIQTWDRGCAAGKAVIGYKISRGQHSWPRTTLPAKCHGKKKRNDCTTTVFDATASVIIPFFDKYTL